MISPAYRRVPSIPKYTNRDAPTIFECHCKLDLNKMRCPYHGLPAIAGPGTERRDHKLDIANKAYEAIQNTLREHYHAALAESPDSVWQKFIHQQYEWKQRWTRTWLTDMLKEIDNDIT